MTAAASKARQPQSLRRRWLKNNRLNAAGDPEHKCPHCNLWWPATTEYFHKKGKRLHSACKDCANEIARDYQQARYVPHPRMRSSAPDCAARDLDQALRGIGAARIQEVA